MGLLLFDFAKSIDLGLIPFFDFSFQKSFPIFLSAFLDHWLLLISDDVMIDLDVKQADGMDNLFQQSDCCRDEDAFVQNYERKTIPNSRFSRRRDGRQKVQENPTFSCGY